MMRAWHIAWKDMRVWLRDASAIGILLGMPVVLIFILGSALGGAQSGELALKIAVVNLDAGATVPVPGGAPTSSVGVPRSIGEEIASVLAGDERLKKLFSVEKLEDAEAAKERVAAGKLAAAVVVPQGFTRDVMGVKPAEITVYGDPGQQTSADIVESVVRSVAAPFSAASIAVQTVVETAQDAGVPPQDMQRVVGEGTGIAIQAATARGALDAVRVQETQAAPEVELRAIDFYGPSMTAMFLMFGAMFGAFATIKERREQTLSRILATPTSAMAVTAGKMLGIFLLGMVQFAVLYLSTRFLFGVRWGGDVLAIFAIAAAEMLAVTGLAILI
ncbi:MAG: ABC transporter permease, partial [Actinobacteria bacterium]